MSAKIHPTAIVSPKARLADDVEVGAFAIIGDDVTVGSGCRIDTHARLQGPLTLGKSNQVGHGAFLGADPQDLKYKGGRTELVIGDRNVFREYVTAHRASGEGRQTMIGNDNYLMAYTHIGHDCVIGNHVIMANGVMVGGHVRIDDNVFIGGLSGLHQFVRVGRYAMVGGMSRVANDLLPFGMFEGNPSVMRGVNIVALERAGFDKKRIAGIREIFKKLFHSETSFADAVGEIESSSLSEDVKLILDFVHSSERGLMTRRKTKS